MSDPIELGAEGARTLPEWLRLQAAQRGAATALRHKQRGLWRSKSWRELEAEVGALASGLGARGFVEGDRLLLEAPAVPEAVAISLAALWLGGAVVVLEPAGAPGRELAVGASGLARFVLVADDAGRARHVAAHTPLALGVVLDADDAALESDPTWVSFDALTLPRASLTAHVARQPVPPVAAHGARAALIRWRAEPSRAPDDAPPSSGSSFRHDELLRRAEALVSRGRWGEAREALAGRELSLGERLEHVLPAWLTAGLCWSFVEHATTEDVDRRELGPELVFGSARDFASLVERVAASLPPRDRGAGRWLHAGLDSRGPGGRWARRLLTARLREVTGLGRARRLVAVGSAAEPAPGVEHLFGLSLFEWPEPESRGVEGEPRASATPAARSGRRLVAFEAAELEATPGSEVG
jgi:long-chain acyl-CoA synthetase